MRNPPFEGQLNRIPKYQIPTRFSHFHSLPISMRAFSENSSNAYHDSPAKAKLYRMCKLPSSAQYFINDRQMQFFNFLSSLRTTKGECSLKGYKKPKENQAQDTFPSNLYDAHRLSGNWMTKHKTLAVVCIYFSGFSKLLSSQRNGNMVSMCFVSG